MAMDEKMYRRFIPTITIVILLLIPQGEAFSTAQGGDRLVIEGEVHEIFTNPLEQWIAIHPDSIPKPEVEYSDLARGYFAFWTNSDANLFLIDIKIRVPAPPESELPCAAKSVMNEVFPDCEQVFASWYTGYLVQPEGKLKKYRHSGYGSIYERYIIYIVEEGRVISMQEMTSRQFRRFEKKEYRKSQKAK